MDKKTRISKNIEKNIQRFKEIYTDCADIKMRTMWLGENKSVECFLAYIEVAVGNTMMERTALGRMLAYLGTVPKEQVVEVLDADTHEQPTPVSERIYVIAKECQKIM